MILRSNVERVDLLVAHHLLLHDRLNIKTGKQNIT